MAEVDSRNPNHPGAATPQATDPLLGRVLNGRFSIMEPIGAGGMGKVYKAIQSPLDRVVAVKVLHPQYSSQDTNFVRRFVLEASLTSKLRHPNTVTVIDYGQTEDNVFYIAMEYLEGRTVAEVLAKEGPIAWERVLHIGQQVCRSLREAHRLGVIHRDLKPANVMLLDEADNDQVKVLDFGLVKSFMPDPRAAESDAKITQAGMLLGSPQYMAPEQARSVSDPRSDVYSFGVLLYEMLTGRPPFVARDYLEVIVKHMREAPPPFAAQRPDIAIPPVVEALVMRCLQKDPGARFQSMDEVLEGIRATGGVQVHHSGTHPRPGSGSWPALATPPPLAVPGSMTPAPRPIQATPAPGAAPGSPSSGAYSLPIAVGAHTPHPQRLPSGAYPSVPPPSGAYPQRLPSGSYAAVPPSGAYPQRPPSGSYPPVPQPGAYPPGFQSGPYPQPQGGAGPQAPSWSTVPTQIVDASMATQSGSFPVSVAPAPAASPRGGKIVWVVIGLLVLVGAGSVGSWWVLHGKPPPEETTASIHPQPVPEPAPPASAVATTPVQQAASAAAGKPVRFRVSSEPSGARVFMGARDLGVTPLTFEMPPQADGTATAELVFILDGYHPLAATAGGSGDVVLSQRLQKKSGRSSSSETIRVAAGSSGASRQTLPAGGLDDRIDAPTMIAPDPKAPPEKKPESPPAPAPIASTSAPPTPAPRTGSEVMPFGEGMSRPELIQNAPITLPREAIQAKVEGLMIVKCVINTSGKLERCRILKSLPFMERAVLDSLYARTYKPITFQGRTVTTEYVFDVRVVQPKK